MPYAFRLPPNTLFILHSMSQRTPEDIAVWERLDDVIMGGQSSSSIEAAVESERGFSGAVWKGDLIVEVRGYCRFLTFRLS